jgi:hypothetical protein
MSAFSDRVRGNKTDFFRVADLEGGERTFTIKHLDEELEVFGETKDVLNFVETGQQLQLNQTTSEWLLDNLGDDPAKYPGHRVTLYLAEYKYKDKTDKGIRLKKPRTVSGEVAQTRSPNPKGDRSKPDLNDEVPF